MSLNKQNIMLRIHGYTILEFLVAVGLSVVVLTLSLEVAVNQKKMFNELEEKVSINTEVRRLGEHVGHTIESVGGQGIAPWLAIDVENNCGARWVFPDCLVSDRVTLLSPKLQNDGSFFPTYRSLLFTSGTGQIDVQMGPPCDLSLLPGQTIAVFLSTGELMVRRVTAQDSVLCTLTTVAEKQASQLTNNVLNTYVSGTIVVVKIFSYFLDRATKKFNVFYNANNDDTMDPDEVTAIYENIFDFQIALGFDVNPVDSSITDTRSNTDEWLYNSPGESWGLGVFAAPVQKSSLLMAKVSLAAGVPTKGIPSGVFTLLDGNAINPGQNVVRISEKSFIFKNFSSY